MAALNPSVWGTLRREHTHNRNLVPIKRYFLRASEQPGFEARRISARFKFKAADPRYMARMPHQKDPVFEIGFGGQFSETSIAEKPLEDRTTVLRLSAFPRLGSGVFERSRESYVELSPAAVRVLDVARTYDLKIDLSGTEVVATLDGREIARHSSEGISRGLVSLQTSWHPIALEALSIEGELASGTIRESLVLSGLVKAP